MDLLLGVLGVVLKVLGVLVAAALVVALGLAIKFRGALRALLAGGAPTPSRVTVRSRSEPRWARKRKARNEIGAFEAAGFRVIGAFEMVEIPDAELLAFVHGGERMYGVTYRHPAVGIWSDVVIRYEDGTGCTASSAPAGGELDQPPWTRNRYEPGAGAERLIELAREAAPEGRKETSAERFAPDFAEAYAREMAWRNERGGPSLSEIERVAESMDMELREGDAETALAATRGQTMARFRSECLASLLTDPDLSDADAHAVTHEGAVVIHDHMTPAEVVYELCLVLDLPDDVLAELEGLAAGNGPPRDLFASFAGRLPEGLRARRVGSVDQPVGADVWVVEPTGPPA